MAVQTNTNYPSKFNLPSPIGRLNPRPVDSTYVWDTLAHAEDYAANNPTAYIGQLIFVQENNKLYKIDNAAGTLVEVGSGVVPEVNIATRTKAGIVKIGKHLYIEEDGTLHATDTTYNIFSNEENGLVPIAPSDQTLFLKSNGTWAAPTFTIPIADRTNLGGVIVGQNLAVTNTGVLSLDKAGCLGYWDCSTGLATDPTSFYSGSAGDSYTYKKGDYFRAVLRPNKYKHTIHYTLPGYGSANGDIYIYDNNSAEYTDARVKEYIPNLSYYYNVSSGWVAVQNAYGNIRFFYDLERSPFGGGVWQSDTITTIYNKIPSGNTYNGTASIATTELDLTSQAFFVYNGTTWEVHDHAPYTLPIATNILGGIVSTTTGTTADRDYSVEVNPSTGAAWVNVPWEAYGLFSTTANGLVPKASNSGDNIKYLRGDGIWAAPAFTLPVASASTLGGILSQTTGTTANRDYKVEVDTQGKAKVNVPWTDTVYTLPTATADVLGGIKVGNNLSITQTGVLNATDTTYEVFTSTVNGLVPAPTASNTTKYLKGDGTWDNPTAIIPIASYNLLGAIKVGYNLVIEEDGTLNALDTKYRIFDVYQNGLVPKPDAEAGETEKYLKGDGTWQAPSFALEPASANILGGIKLGQNLAWNTETGRVDATDTTYTVATTTAAGLLPQLLSAHANKFMRADGQWVEVDVSTKQNLVEQIVLI